MNKLINYLEKHPIYNVLLALLYFLIIVFSHGIIGELINGSFENVSRNTYNLIISSFCIIFGIGTIGFLFKRILSSPQSKLLIGIIALTLILVILSFKILFVINIEAIHFIQYGIFAVIIFPLFRSALATMIIVTIAGSVDELYQYLILDPSTWYYDFNDVLINAIGAGMGLTLLKILKAETKIYDWTNWFKKFEWCLLWLIILLLSIAFFLGHFSINMNYENPAFFTLFKRVPAGFWYVPKGPYARFHILLPIPGIFLTCFVIWFYSQLDKILPVNKRISRNQLSSKQA